MYLESTYRIACFALLLSVASCQLLFCDEEFDLLDTCHNDNACTECRILRPGNLFTGFCNAINTTVCNAFECCEGCETQFSNYETCIDGVSLIACDIECDQSSSSTPEESTPIPDGGEIGEEIPSESPGATNETLVGELEEEGCFDKFADFAACAVNNPLQCGACFIENIPIPEDISLPNFCETAADSICGFGNCCEPCAAEFGVFDECFEDVVDDVTFGLCEFECEEGDGSGGLIDDCTSSFNEYSACLARNVLQCVSCFIENIPGQDGFCQEIQNTVCGFGQCCENCDNEFDVFEDCLESVSSIVTINNCVIDCDEDIDDPTPVTPAPTPAPDDGNDAILCFSGVNNVLVADKGYVPMKDLVIGDMAQTEEGEFSRIYSFGHFSHHSKSEYLQLHTEDQGSPLEITKDHLVFVETRGSVPAFAVSVGDRVLGAGKNVAEVTKITKVTRAGAFAPFTESGTIVVNGVLASSYVSLQDDESGSFVIGGTKTFPMHWLSHSLQAPHRLICHLNMNICANETYTSSGISHWVYHPLLFSKWIIRQHPAVMTLLSVPIVLLAFAMNVLEIFFMNFYVGVICLGSMSFLVQTKGIFVRKEKRV